MTTTLDPRAYTTAIKAAIKAELGPNNAYTYGTVPGDKNHPDPVERARALPNIFVLVSVERRYTPWSRLTGQSGMSGWRVSVRCVGRTADEAHWAAFKVSEALNEARLTIGDHTTTPLQFESDAAPAFDDGRFSGSAIYTFTH